MVLGLGMHRGVPVLSEESFVPVDCLTSPVPALGEAGGQKPAGSVKMLHFLFLTGPGFRGH